MKTHTDKRLHGCGQLQVKVKFNGQVAKLPLLVVKGDGSALWGRTWLQAMRLNWKHIKQVKQVTQGLDSLLQQYSEVFRDELGTLRDVKVKQVIPEDVPARFFKPQPVPYAIRGAIEHNLERLESLGVIEKINYSNWAAPIVAVPKLDSTVRIWGDYKVTLNSVLQEDQYPVPKADNLFATLCSG